MEHMMTLPTLCTFQESKITWTFAMAFQKLQNIFESGLSRRRFHIHKARKKIADSGRECVVRYLVISKGWDQSRMICRSVGRSDRYS